MNDFRSYSSANDNNKQGNGGTPYFDGNSGRSSDTANKIPNSEDATLDNTIEMAKIISKAMNGKSTAQIMQTIIAEAERGKREGRLTNADLDNFYNMLAPILDGAKKRKLKQVIEKLKSI